MNTTSGDLTCYTGNNHHAAVAQEKAVASASPDLLAASLAVRVTTKLVGLASKVPNKGVFNYPRRATLSRTPCIERIARQSEVSHDDAKRYRTCSGDKDLLSG